MSVDLTVAATETQKVLMNANDVTTIISNINSLYSTVIYWTFGIVAFIGVLLPVYIAILQNRQLKADRKLHTEEIDKQIRNAKETLISELDKKLANEVEVYEKRICELEEKLDETITKNAARADAKNHHSQGTMGVKEGKFINALCDYTLSIAAFAVADEENNMQTSLACLVKNVLPEIKKIDFDSNEEIEKHCNDAKTVIMHLNENRRYDSKLEELNAAIKEAKTRS